MKAGSQMSFENGRCGDYSSMNWELYGKRLQAINNDTILRDMKSFGGTEFVRLTRERRN